MADEQIHLFVSGMVQGIGYRYFTRHSASSLGLVGWVRNLPDGRVEIAAEGEKVKIEELIEICQKGPENAKVSGIEVQSRNEIRIRSFTQFQIR